MSGRCPKGRWPRGDIRGRYPEEGVRGDVLGEISEMSRGRCSGGVVRGDGLGEMA